MSRWQLCCSAVADDRRQILDYSPGQKNNAIRTKCAPICLKFWFRDDLETQTSNSHHYSCGRGQTRETIQRRSCHHDYVHVVHKQISKVYMLPGKVPQVGPYTRSLCLGKFPHIHAPLAHTHTPSSLVQVTTASSDHLAQRTHLSHRHSGLPAIVLVLQLPS